MRPLIPWECTCAGQACIIARRVLQESTASQQSLQHFWGPTQAFRHKTTDRKSFIGYTSQAARAQGSLGRIASTSWTLSRPSVVCLQKPCWNASSCPYICKEVCSSGLAGGGCSDLPLLTFGLLLFSLDSSNSCPIWHPITIAARAAICKDILGQHGNH